MILGSDKAKVSDGALGQTFESAAYPVEIDGKYYCLHDTVGLGKHSGGTVDSAKAVGRLYQLLTRLSDGGGVNLLVFVIKCGRLTETINKNYKLFHHGFCDSKVPIVIVVTGCENAEPTMDAWWIDNNERFSQAGMAFEGHACVCAFKGAKKKDGRGGSLIQNHHVRQIFPRSGVKEIGLRLSENRATHRKIGLADSSFIAHALSNNSCPHQLAHRPPLSWNEPSRSTRSVRATARQSPTLGPMPRHRPRHPQ